MKRLKAHLVRSTLAALLAATAGAAQAGRSCATSPPSAANVQRAMALAQATAQRLDASGQAVVAIARVGQDLSAYGQRYSHLALAYREGRHWRVVHKLNQCGTAVAAVYRQGLGEFFLDDLHEYEAGIVLLAPEVQARLRPLLADNRRVAQLHTAPYSMLAYPWAQTYQQSNQWALETLALSQAPNARDRERAQAWLKLQGYEPATLRLGPLTRLGARMTRANVAFDDHPHAKRFADRIETVTADSVFQWLARSGLGGAVQVVRVR